MREIKFRAWDGKVMIDPVWGWNPSANHYEHYNDFHENWMYGLDTKNVILMQFTGLKDKNGKEIYEGDIVRGGKKKFEVFWNSIGTGQWWFLDKKCPVSKINLGQLEVIGNIYENPELVKGDG